MRVPLTILILGVSLKISAAPVGVMVPAYFYPGALWTSLSNAATRVPLTAIMNPDNGQGAPQDANYVVAIANLHAAGGKVIGYVATGYGTSNLVTGVQVEIERWLAFYSVDGFFMDEMTNDADTNHLNYYAAIYQYIKGKGTNLTVTANPGTNTEEDYLKRPTADALVIFENGSGYPTFAPSGWVTNYLARHFVHLVYNISSATTMTNDVNLAVSRNAGFVYVTNDHGANPWDTLPTYWDAEVNYIQSLNQTLPATRLTLTTFSNRIPSMKIAGAAGTYEIQATTNYFFSNWFSVGTVSAPGGAGNFSDTNAVNSTNRFYRTAQ